MQLLIKKLTPQQVQLQISLASKQKILLLIYDSVRFQIKSWSEFLYQSTVWVSIWNISRSEIMFLQLILHEITNSHLKCHALTVDVDKMIMKERNVFLKFGTKSKHMPTPFINNL